MPPDLEAPIRDTLITQGRQLQLQRQITTVTLAWGSQPNPADPPLRVRVVIDKPTADDYTYQVWYSLRDDRQIQMMWLLSLPLTRSRAFAEAAWVAELYHIRLCRIWRAFDLGRPLSPELQLNY